MKHGVYVVSSTKVSLVQASRHMNRDGKKREGLKFSLHRGGWITVFFEKNEVCDEQNCSFFSGHLLDSSEFQIPVRLKYQHGTVRETEGWSAVAIGADHVKEAL